MTCSNHSGEGDGNNDSQEGERKMKKTCSNHSGEGGGNKGVKRTENERQTHQFMKLLNTASSLKQVSVIHLLFLG